MKKLVIFVFCGMLCFWALLSLDAQAEENEQGVE